MKRRIVPIALFAALTLAAHLSFPAGAATPADRSAAARAVDWLVGQQRDDGGFEVAGFPGFETPDAVLAIAERAQTVDRWDATAARAAVAAVRKGGKSPLDALDDYAESLKAGTSAGPAAKLVVVARSLGLDPARFNPGNDAPTNLVALVDAGAKPDGSYGVFNATLFVALAHRAIGRAVPAATVRHIEAAQQPDGGWGFTGEPGAGAKDPDTTGLAVQALVAAGRATKGAVRRGARALASMQSDDAGWGEGALNPNSTAQAVLGLVAAGIDPGSSCLRAADGATADDAVRAAQAADGHIAGPFDSFGLNTSGTSQAVQGLLRRWLPLVRGAPSCPDARYRVVDSLGAVTTFGSPAPLAVPRRTKAPVVDAVADPSGDGLWLAAADGEIVSVGAAKLDRGKRRLRKPIVALAATPTGKGLWLAAADGAVFTAGDATFKGSRGGKPLSKPIVDIASTPTGAGYWLLAADGGVFAYGDARFHGSPVGAAGAGRPMVALVPSTSGKGYRLIADDGRATRFGDAPSYPSAASRVALVDVRRTFNGRGLLGVTARGTVVGAGNARRLGNASGGRVVAIV